MSPSLRAALLLIPLACAPAVTRAADAHPILIIHGGAGAVSREDMSAEREARFRAALRAALEKGYAVLSDGGSALDAVTRTIVMMEDDELFNAGRGAVFSYEGRNELDAAVMEGARRTAGAVAGVRLVKNPILLAREVMENSPHVLLTGAGAEEFAITRRLEMQAPEYFRSQRRWQQLIEMRDRQDRAVESGDEFGTVGAVALDQWGNLAAGTSTGGLTGKRWGRVGDSPIVGAGTYADNASCAVSATGQGEYFIRGVVAHDICARMRYLRIGVEESARRVVLEELSAMGGTGGVIALDGSGDYALVFNTAGMYRGVIQQTGEPRVAMFADERL